MGKGAIVEYAAIPGLGRVRWHVYNEYLIDLVNYLKGDGEFVRLGNMKQLGVISKSLASAHHTRHEYLSLFMYLLDIVGDHGGQAAVNTDINILGEKIAKKELIKFWFILGQYGHCFETYAAERYLLHQLRKKKTLQKAFLSTFFGDLKSYTEEVIKKGDWYKLYPAISYWRLLNSGLEGILRDFAVAALEEMVNASENRPSSDKVADAYTVLSTIRELAYLYLDIQFTARSVHLDPVALALQIHEEPGLVSLLKDRFDARGAMLESVGSYLCETVYVTPENGENVYLKLVELKKRHRRTINELSSGNAIDSIQHIISDLIEQKNGSRILNSADVSYAFSLPYPLSTESDLEIYRSFKKEMGIRYRVYVSRWPRNPKHVEVFFLHPNGQGNPYEYVSIAKLYKALKVTTGRFDKHEGIPETRNNYYSKIAYCSHEAKVSYFEFLPLF